MSVAAIQRGNPIRQRSDTDNRALYLVAGLSALLLALMLPFMPWIRVVNAEALFEAMELKASAIKKLGDSYPVYTFLGFVQDSKQGALGLWAFVLLLVAVAAAGFHLWGLILFLLRRRLGEKQGLLGMYGRLLGGMVFSLALSLGTLGFLIFANARYGLTGFAPGIALCITPVASLVGYFIGKRLQKAERVLRREHGFAEEFRRNWILFLFLVPCFVFFLINNYLPMVGIYFAFTQFNFKDSLFASPFVGFKNFEFLMRSEIVHLTVNTVLYNIVFIVLGNVLQIFFAILVSQVKNRHLKKTSQTMIFMPYFVSYVILRVLVFNMFEYDVGLINNFMSSMGRAKIDFYNTPSYWPWIITLFYLWKNVGYGMVVYLATITGISDELYEAAQIDGANILQQIRYITVGLGIAQPRFSWNCEGGVKQTAYQILAERGGEVVWDSGKVASSSMTHIQYAGKPLASRDRVAWSVVLWDENDAPGEAAASWFELGLMNPSDWTAKWISGDTKPNRKRRYPVDCFRKAFEARKSIASARLYATARGVYDVTINGHRLEDFILAPGMTDYRKRIQYQTYDVTGLLAEENTVELRLADGWFRGSVAAYGVTNVFGMQTSVLAQLEITYADGSKQTVVTDDSWQWSDDGPIRFADLKDGEVYDASMKPSYRGKAKVVAAPKDAVIAASDNVPVTEHERLSAKLLPSKVLDFGQNIAGYIEFTVKGKEGQRFKLVCGETLDAEGNVDLHGIQEVIPAKGWSQLSLVKKLLTGKVSGTATVTPKQEICFTCSGGVDRYKTSFAVFGFRYAQVGGDIDVNPDDFTAIAVYSDMEQTGDFRCSDERVNRLVQNTRWSMKGNFLDVPTDCPTRAPGLDGRRAGLLRYWRVSDEHRPLLPQVVAGHGGRPVRQRPHFRGRALQRRGDDVQVHRLLRTTDLT